MSYFLAVGCSHTAGIGIEPDEIYVQQLSKDLNIECVNLSVPGSNSEYTLQKIVETLGKEQLPNFVIAQWPNVFRKTFWYNDEYHMENINSCGEIFHSLVKAGENNFTQPWIQHILTADLLCKAFNLPVYHICLEYYKELPSELIKNHNIQLHMDHKEPGRSWLFDNGASDNFHHSAFCHRAWAHRINGIINENTQ